MTLREAELVVLHTERLLSIANDETLPLADRVFCGSVALGMMPTVELIAQGSVEPAY